MQDDNMARDYRTSLRRLFGHDDPAEESILRAPLEISKLLGEDPDDTGL